MREFPEKWTTLSAVLSHDWLTGMRGGERVLEILCRGFPNAPIFSLIHNRTAISDLINSHSVTTSWLQGVPGIMQHYRLLLPLFPRAIERLHTPPADVMISTSHCIAKALKPAEDTRHLCYCFTPMRYAWLFYEEYFGGNPLKALLAKPFLSALRRWDRRTSSRVHRFVAISHHVQKRIRDFYDRPADVVYPPVDTERWTPTHVERGNVDLIVSALVPYKRIDLAVRAYTRAGLPLRIVGVGGETSRLQALAGPRIEFLGWQTDETIRDLYRTSRLLIFPGEEDFGLVPMEAHACGCPVVAYGRGGALETIAEGVSGVFFDEQTEEALLDAVDRCAGTTWDRDTIRAQAETFGVQPFINGLAACIERTLADHRT